MLDEISYPEPDPNQRPAAEVWNERYAGENYIYGKETIPLLKTFAGQLKKGKGLDVAMGEGRNLVFLAQQGFQMSGLDVSSRAIDKAKKLMEEKKVTAEIKVQNLDFFLMPLMKYDTIVMTYFRPVKRFFSEIRRGLVLGGTFVLESFTVEHYKSQSPPDPKLDFFDCYRPNEVLGLLRDFQILYYKELPEGHSHLVQAIARKSKP